MAKKRVVIAGSSGMLGHALFNRLWPHFDVFGLQRSTLKISSIPGSDAHVRPGFDISDWPAVEQTLRDLRPDVVVNCVGIIKQLTSTGREEFVYTNAYFPHRLADWTDRSGARLLHFSTDCVFDGKKGHYTEEDHPTAYDDYGLSKYLGEVVSRRNALTLRTSIIGHELSRSLSLIDWFLSQQSAAKGYVKAIYSGLPTVEVADFLKVVIEQHPDLRGLYHLSSRPITKFDLLKKVGAMYKTSIELVPDESVVIDRSLNSDRLRRQVGAVAATWDDWDAMIRKMHSFYLELKPGRKENGNISR